MDVALGRAADGDDAREQAARSELGGLLQSLTVSVGDPVRAGQPVAWVESMKMEHPVTSPVDGEVAALAVAVGEPVEQDGVVAWVRPGPARAPAAPGVPPASASSGAGTAAQDECSRSARTWPRCWRGGPVSRTAPAPRRCRGARATGRRTIRENIADLVDPGSWVEYGGLAVAAQRAVRELDDLVARTPADGFVAGLARVNGERVGEQAAACAVAGYDYTVLAGTQGMAGHLKKDRLFDVVERLRLPVVLFAEGGGGRPSDTDWPVVSGLTTQAFRWWAGLSGLVPRIGIASGRCFAGNAGLLGACDVVIATGDATIGMGGPAMIEGAGLGSVRPEEIGPAAMHARTGVVDVLVEDDAAAVAAARTALGFFQGPVTSWSAPHQSVLRDLVPLDRRRAFDVRSVVATLADEGSVLELRSAFARGMVTALVRLEGHPVGVLANDSAAGAGAITSDAADKAARFLQLCDAFGLPVLSLVDTPGIMVGPAAEETGLVRHTARLFTVGARLSVPLVAVVLRKAYGLGAQAMVGGSLLAPVLTVSWPTGEFGAMGVEGAVALALRDRLAAADPQTRQALIDEAVRGAYERGRALSVATYVEIDDVIDPAETRRVVVAAFTAARSRVERPAARRWVDTW